MAISQLSRWDDVGSTPGAGLAKYIAGDQPICEYDNWFCWSAAKDVENLITALENVATGHDHDGVNSKQVDGSDVINTPAGNVAATNVQAAIDELDAEKETPAGAQTKVDTHAADTSTHGVAEVADKATVSTEIDNDIATHAAIAVNVHGVGGGNNVASDADIDTHAADTSTHGVSGDIQGSEDKDVANGIAGLDASTRLSTDIGGMPTGVIFAYGAAAAPSGYLLCDGAAVSRTTYSDLFGVIGVGYGVGNGSTTFNVPDLQGNIPVGIGGSGVTNLGDTGGEQTHTLSINEMPPHDHSTQVGGSSGVSDLAVLSSNRDPAYDTGSAGGGAAHENMQPYVGTEYIIKI